MEFCKCQFQWCKQCYGNSIRGISQAGTIFGDLRKSILDEEQKAIDNAYREKEFNEQVSQFAATHGLDENMLKEQIRHNQESERLIGEGHDVQREGIQANAPLIKQHPIRTLQYHKANQPK